MKGPWFGAERLTTRGAVRRRGEIHSSTTFTKINTSTGPTISLMRMVLYFVFVLMVLGWFLVSLGLDL